MDAATLRMLIRVRDWMVSGKWSATASNCKEAFDLYCYLRDFIAKQPVNT